MSYKSVYVCDQCSEESVSVSSNYPPLPTGWRAIWQDSLSGSVTFCSLVCLASWAVSEAHQKEAKK